MVAIASSDLTVTVLKQRIEGKTRRNLCKITFGNGTLTYPSGGVPLPAKGSFGMKQSLDYILPVDWDDGNGIMWKTDYENKKLRGYIMGLDLSAAGAGTLDDFPINTTNEALATSGISVGLVGASAGVTYLGRLKELATTHAPAAQTMYVEAVGF